MVECGLAGRPSATTLQSAGSGPDPGATESWSLLVLHTPVAGLRSRRVELATRLGIGRALGPGVELAIDDAKLSRLHATITRAGVIVEIHDHASRNGTFVNGHRIATRMLQRGDLVRVGDTLLELADGGPAGETGDPLLVGNAPAFVAATALAARVAPSAIPVLLLGETGTGKDVLAQYVHRQSGRRGPFVAVNCAALADDLFEATLFGHRKGAFTGATSDSPGLFLEAQGGTLFLDEIGELGLAHQAKLLRALDAHEIIPVGATRSVHTDARVIAATNLDLAARTAEGRFRSDLTRGSPVPSFSCRRCARGAETS
ncbi:MAG: sigma-54-dependent Fis family transcriptional regulator [Kofleriaceae bacterium]